MARSASSHANKTQGDPLASIDDEQLFERGQVFAQQGDFTRAEQYLTAAMAQGHTASRVLPLLIEVCVRGNRYDMALFHARPYLDRHPENWRLRYLIATLYTAVGNVSSARQELERVLSEVPKAADAHFSLGRLLWESSDLEGASSHFGSYLELAPDGVHAHEAKALMRLANESAEVMIPVRIEPDGGSVPESGEGGDEP